MIPNVIRRLAFVAAFVAIIAVVGVVQLDLHGPSNPPIVAEDLTAPEIDENFREETNLLGPEEREALAGVLPIGGAVVSGSLQQSFQEFVGAEIRWITLPEPEAVVQIQTANEPELVRLAREEKDVHAAAVLGAAIAQCRLVPRSRSEFEREIERLEASRIQSSSPVDGDQIAPDHEIPQIVEILSGQFERCETLRSTLGDDTTDYTKLAADSGHSGAMIDYASSRLRSDPSTARAYLEKAWQDGVHHALKWKSDAEAFLYERGVDPLADVESAASLTAYAALEEAFMDRMGAPPSHPVRAASNEHIQLAREKLDLLVPYKQEQALARAKELIESNERCCYSPL